MLVEDLPKKVQYITVDSEFVNGTNNTFSIDFTLASNTQVDNMSQVIGIKLVDFYITQVGENDAGNVNVAKYVDIICPDIPLIAQIRDERVGQLLARIPLERSFSGSNGFIVRDKQWKSFNRNTNYFNPMSIKKLNFQIFEHQGDGDYVTLQPDATFYMILEVTTIDYKEKPNDKNSKILEALDKLLIKIDELNQNVSRIPKKEKEKKKYPFSYLVGILLAIVAAIVFFVNRFKGKPPV